MKVVRKSGPFRKNVRLRNPPKRRMLVNYLSAYNKSEEHMVAGTSGDSSRPTVAPHLDTAAEKSRLDQIVSHDFTTTVLAYGVTIGFFALIFLLLVVSWRGSGVLAPAGAPPETVAPAGSPTPGASPSAKSPTAGEIATTGAFTNGPFHDLLNTLVGIVGTAWAGIIAFYFGSSTGSRQQLQTLSQVALAQTSSLNPPDGDGQRGSTGPTGPGPTGPSRP
jgi:hypothetical protein